MPNNREWALLLWLIVLLVWALANPKARSSIVDLAKAAASLKIIVPVLVLVAWVAGLITVGHRLGLWHADFATGTVIWFVTAGLMLFGRFEDASKAPNFFRRKVVATLEVTVAIEVYSEVFVLALPAEIVLQPFLFLLGGMSVVAAQRQEHRAAKKVVDFLIVAVSLTLLAFVTANLIENWDAVDKGSLLLQVALPIWMTVGLLPYVYIVGLYAAYESAFLRLDWRSNGNWWERLRVKLALLASFHVKARELGRFSGPWQMQVAESTSFRAARAVVREFRRRGPTSAPVTGQDGA